jgi:hypothetical protein
MNARPDFGWEQKEVEIVRKKRLHFVKFLDKEGWIQ